MVYVQRCETYEIDKVTNLIDTVFREFDIYNKIKDNKRVFVKMNCLGPFNKEMGITTHPVVLKAVLSLIKPYTNNIIVGDNPAIRDLIPTLKKCGLYVKIIMIWICWLNILLN